MTRELEKRILEKIRDEKIRPTPRWFFILKNSFYLTLLGISIFIGSLSFSILFYIFSNNSSEILQRYDIEKLKFAIFFWLVILILFLFLALRNYKKTNNSYKYTLSTILNMNLIISFTFGFILYTTGIAQKTDEFSANHLDFYQKNIKITEIKKEVFLKKLKEIGITKELLKEYPELKGKIELKFNEKVLGKTYLETGEKCEKPDFECYNNDLFFKDENGCGCKKIYK